MRKLVFSLLIVVVLSTACLSTSGTTGTKISVVDRGEYNPKLVSKEELCTLNIDKFVGVSKFDDEKVAWFLPKKELAPQEVIIPSGLHVLSVNYNDGDRFTLPFPVVGLFVKGKEYSLTARIDGKRVKVDIVDTETGDSIMLDTAKLKGEDPSILSTYIKKILNPTMDEVGHSVVLENDDYRITFLPDMVFNLEVKKTGEKVIGRKGFEMDFSMKSGKSYLLISDVSKMSRDDFLTKSNYKENAQYIYTVSEISETEIVLKFEKQKDLSDTILQFKYREIE